MLGAGTAKVAKILGLTLQEARAAVEDFIAAYPGLARLKGEIIPKDAERGYFEGFDGRVIQSDEYHMLAGYLQCGESLVMKLANRKWQNELKASGIPYRAVNDVHDEWQTECDDDPATYNHIQQVQCNAITWAGLQFQLNCPLAGSSKVGRNWYETH